MGLSEIIFRKDCLWFLRSHKNFYFCSPISENDEFSIRRLTTDKKAYDAKKNVSALE